MDYEVRFSRGDSALVFDSWRGPDPVELLSTVAEKVVNDKGYDFHEARCVYMTPRGEIEQWRLVVA